MRLSRESLRLLMIAYKTVGKCSPRQGLCHDDRFNTPVFRCLGEADYAFAGAAQSSCLFDTIALRMENAILTRAMGHRAGKELNEMNWFSSWLDKRRVRDLKRRIAQMKMRAERAAEIEAELRMPTLETMTGRILQERIVVLEKAVEKIEAQPGTAGD